MPERQRNEWNAEEDTLATIFLAYAQLLQPAQNHLSPSFLRKGDDHGQHLCVQSAGLNTGAEEMVAEEVSPPAHRHIATSLTRQRHELCHWRCSGHSHFRGEFTHSPMKLFGFFVAWTSTQAKIHLLSSIMT